MNKYEDALIVEVEQQRKRIAELEAAQQAAFSMLELFGIPRTRAKTVANGVDVLATRYRRAAFESDRLIAALTAERDALRADAERYRWLREHANTQFTLSAQLPATDGCGDLDVQWYGGLRKEHQDAAIDAALAAKGE